MHQEIIICGTGGQGVMVIGQLIAHAAVVEDKNIVWFPSYGPETRGGTADCTVIVSSDEIGSPVTTTPDTLIAMSQNSLDKFLGMTKPGGIILVNSSLVEVPKDRDDCKIVALPVNDVADELGNVKVANMVMLGAYVELVNPVKLESVIQSLTQVLPPHRQNLIPINEQALRRGAALITK